MNGGSRTTQPETPSAVRHSSSAANGPSSMVKSRPSTIHGPRSTRPRGLIVLWLVLGALCLLSLASMIRYIQLDTLKAYGRYLFPATSAAALLTVLGLSRLLPSRAHWLLGAGLPAGLSSLSIWALVFVLMPAYRPPPIYSSADHVAPRHSLDVTFGDRIRLLGVDPPARRLGPGDTLTLTLYWQALADLDRDYAVYLHVDRIASGQRVGQRDTYPGLGNWPTSNWRAGEILADTYRIRLAAYWPTPAALRVTAGLFDPAAQTRLPVASGGSTVLDEPVVAEFGAPGPATIPADAHMVPLEQGSFAGTAWLRAFSQPSLDGAEGYRITLYWQALNSLPTPYTVFVHLVDAEGHLIAQHDGPPAGGAYPTPFWSPGDIVPDEHVLRLPRAPSPGRYQLRVGLYDSATQQRLPLETEANGQSTFFTIDLPHLP